MAGITTRVLLSVVAVVLLPPWGLLLVGVYWTSRIAQSSRRQVEAESGENFENKTSLGLPFTSRW